MNLRIITLIAAIGFLLGIIVHFALFEYEYLSEYPRMYVGLLFPLIRDLPLSIFLFTLYAKQKS